VQDDLPYGVRIGDGTGVGGPLVEPALPVEHPVPALLRCPPSVVVGIRLRSPCFNVGSTARLCHVVERLVAEQVSRILNVPPHPRIRRHAVHDGKADQRRCFNAPGHQLAVVTVRQPALPEPRTGLWRDRLCPVCAGRDHAEANHDRGQAVALDGLSIKQWPSLGVHTKGRKAATTYLLGIPDLLEVVRSWDRLLRAHLGGDDLGYAHIHCDGSRFLPGQPATDTRRHRVRKGMRQLCKLAGVEYKRPHTLRHGHALYALGRARTIAELKAVSQNLMHSSIAITDGVYGVLSDGDLRARIAGLTKEKSAGVDDPALATLVDLVAERLASAK
jgi:hypothetical protein